MKKCGLCQIELEAETGLCPECHTSIRFVLLPTAGAPIPLVPERELTFGRGEGCSVRICDRSVSRNHARIEWIGRSPVVHDTSRHGTLVNGRPVASHPLRRDDLVRMGGFQFSVVDRSRSAQRSPTHDVTQASEVVTLQGRVTPGSLCELVQGLALGRKTGRLYVSNSAGERSWLALRDGVPFAALQGQRIPGEEAALALLATDCGGFVFCEGEEVRESTPIQTPLMNLLLEATRRQDEASFAKTEIVRAARAKALRAEALRAG